MAGDVGIHEQAIVDGTGARDVSGLATEIVEGSGRVTHQYGSRVLVAALPPDAAQAIERQVPDVTVTAEAEAISESTTSGLDQDEALGLRAFALRQSDQFILAKAQRPLDGAAWDSEEAT